VFYRIKSDFKAFLLENIRILWLGYPNTFYCTGKEASMIRKTIYQFLLLCLFASFSQLGAQDEFGSVIASFDSPGSGPTGLALLLFYEPVSRR